MARPTQHEPNHTVVMGKSIIIDWHRRIDVIILYLVQSAVNYRERKCADTICTVPVTRAGHFQCQHINIFLWKNIWKPFYKTAFGNCFGLKLPKCWLQFKKNFFSVSLIIIFGTLSYPITDYRRILTLNWLSISNQFLVVFWFSQSQSASLAAIYNSV